MRFGKMEFARARRGLSAPELQRSNRDSFGAQGVMVKLSAGLSEGGTSNPISGQWRTAAGEATRLYD
jgi:hypothetical protein